jgi:hypothetical protein
MVPRQGQCHTPMAPLHPPGGLSLKPDRAAALRRSPRKSLPHQSPAPRLAADPGRERPDPTSGPPDLPPRAATVAMAGVRVALLHRPGESAAGREGPAAAILGACAGLPASPSGSGREGGRGGALWCGARWCRRPSRPERGRLGAYAVRLSCLSLFLQSKLKQIYGTTASKFLYYLILWYYKCVMYDL